MDCILNYVEINVVDHNEMRYVSIWEIEINRVCMRKQLLFAIP